MNIWHYQPRRASALALATCALCASAWSIVWRHDRDANLYIELATQPQFAPVGQFGIQNNGNFNGFGSGTLIADGRWVLTAAHVVDVDFLSAPGDLFFRLGDSVYQAEAFYIHSRWNGDIANGGDIALVRLTQQVSGVTPALLYQATNSLVAQTGYSVGFGGNGNGQDGYTDFDDTRRAMENIIDVYGSVIDSLPDDVFLSDFDSPDSDTNTLSDFGSSAEPLNLEGMGAPGDSGGAVFVQIDGVWYLAGVHSFLADANAFGASWGNEQPDARYGDVLGSVRVDYYADWINATVPEPTSMAALAVGVLGLLARRRRA